MNAGKKVKCLFVAPSLTRAGAEIQAVDLVNGLDTKSFEKYLFTFSQRLDQQGRLDKRIHFYNLPRRYKFDLSPAKSIASLVDREDIDVIHCTLQIALWMGWIGAKLSHHDPSLVIAIHTTINWRNKDEWLDKWLYQWLMRGCHKVIFVCKTQESIWLKRFPFLQKKSQVIHNGVDTEYFKREPLLEAGKEYRKLIGIPDRGKIICSIAGFRPEKGHVFLVDAFERVLREIKDAYLVFAGDGPLRASIQQAVLDCGMQKNVRFLGSVDDVRPLLAASDLSIIASTAVETFSMAMLESMAMRVPLVATDIGGTSEAVISGKTGMIVKPESAEDLAFSIMTLLKDNELCRQMGDNSRSLVEQRFTKSRMIAEYEELFCSVLAKNKSTRV